MPTTKLVDNPWERERRTAAQYLADLSLELGGMVVVDRGAELCEGNLKVWLDDPARGFARPTLEKIRRAYGVPISALVQRDRPIYLCVRAELTGPIE